MKYLLNSAVIPSEGVYRYKHVSVKRAISWVRKNEFKSTIGYKETCDAIKEVIGIDVIPNRDKVFINIGDECLIFRLKCRLEDARSKGKLGKEFIINNLELGILKRLK